MVQGKMHHENDLGSKWADVCHISNKTFHSSSASLIYCLHAVKPIIIALLLISRVSR